MPSSTSIKDDWLDKTMTNDSASDPRVDIKRGTEAANGCVVQAEYFFCSACPFP